MVSVAQRSFSGGEISPELFGHVDHAKYPTAVRTCRNNAVMRHGGVVTRPGLQFVAEVADSSATVRLIPFKFNASINNTYIVELSNLKVRFYQNGGQVVESSKAITGTTQANPCVITSVGHGYTTNDEVVISGIVGMTQLNGRNFLITVLNANTFSLRDKSGNAIDSTAYTAYSSGGAVSRVYTLTSPYAQADLPNLKYSQTGDVVTIVHPSYAPRELQRLGATNWQFVVIDFSSGPAIPGTPAATGAAGAPSPYVIYIVTAVTGSGEESYWSADSSATSSALNLPTAAAPIALSWAASAGASYYKIYRAFKSATGIGPWGFIGTATSNIFLDTNLTPDYTNQPPSFLRASSGAIVMSSANDYPSTVGFIQQRRAFGNSNNNPTTSWLSVSGDYSSMLFHPIAPDDGDAMTFSPASEQINSIQHIVDLKALLLLTSGAEIWVQGDAAGIVKPTAINPQAQSYFGAGVLKPIVVGDICIFQQARSWFVRDFGFDFSVDGYRGNDLTIFSPHLFRGYTVTDWCYQQIPNSIIWAIRSDGLILGLTYLREQQIFAWHRHDTSGGTVESVACVPESPEDGVYFVVKRTINGATKRYVERLATFQWPAYNPAGQSTTNYGDIINASQMDSWLKYDGTNYGATTMVLSGSAWTVGSSLTLTASVSFFTSAMVGDQIFINDADGTQIRCLITAYSSGTVVTVTPQRDVPSDMRAVSVLNWAHAILTVTNLWTLEGKTVAIYADRFVVGSPNNSAYPTYTVTNGQVTLDKPYAVIYIGLPITSDLETLDIDVAFGESLSDRKEIISRVGMLINNARGLFGGTLNPDTDALNTNADPLYRLMELKEMGDRATYDESPNVLSQPVLIDIPCEPTHQGHVFIRQVDPLPAQILSIVPMGMIGVPGQTSPYYLRP